MNYPVLGVLDNDEMQGDGLAEAFIEACGEKKLIVVTSEHAHEGKTSTCKTLAKKLYEAGKKVLLVDADLRKRIALSAEFRMREHVFRNRDYMDFAVDAGYCTMVSVATVGLRPHDIFESDKFLVLLDTARVNYDYTIIDTSPIGMFDDAETIAENTDGILYVHSPDYDDITRELENVVGMVECRLLYGKRHDRRALWTELRR